MKNKTLIVGLASVLVAALSACTTPTHSDPKNPPAQIGFEDGKPFANYVSGATVAPSIEHVTEGKLSAKVSFGSAAKTYRQAQLHYATPLAGTSKLTFDVFANKAVSGLDVVLMVNDWKWKSTTVSLVEGVNAVSINLADIKGDGVSVSSSDSTKAFVLANWTETSDAATPIVLHVDNVRFQ